MFMFIHFCLTNGFIHQTNRKKYLAESGECGHSLNGTGLDCLSLSGEDIAEWIAAQDGALA